MTVWMARVLAVAAGALLVGAGASYAQLAQCAGDGCVNVSVVSPAGGPFAVGDTLTVGVNFAQGTGDTPPGGRGDVAAIAFTLAIPNLELADCSSPDANGLTPAFDVSSVSDTYRVVIENTQCVDATRTPPLDRTHCLCPTREGDTRDPFINVVVFGPKDLPTPGAGSVTIPPLPASGKLLDVNLKVSADATGTSSALHLYNEVSDAAAPTFGALLSIGDTQAVDVTGCRGPGESISSCTDRSGQSNVTTVDGQVAITGTVSSCIGDCNNDCEISLLELQQALNFFVSDTEPTTCPSYGSSVSLLNLQKALNVFVGLNGVCPQPCP